MALPGSFVVGPGITTRGCAALLTVSAGLLAPAIRLLASAWCYARNDGIVHGGQTPAVRWVGTRWAVPGPQVLVTAGGLMRPAVASGKGSPSLSLPHRARPSAARGADPSYRTPFWRMGESGSGPVFDEGDTSAPRCCRWQRRCLLPCPP